MSCRTLYLRQYLLPAGGKYRHHPVSGSRHNCRTAYQPDASECELLGLDSDTPPTLYLPNGCDKCNQSGYEGRTGIYELIEIDDDLKKLIHDGSGEHELEKYVRQHSPSIRADGIRRILAGQTSLEEVLRVTRED